MFIYEVELVPLHFESSHVAEQSSIDPDIRSTR